MRKLVTVTFTGLDENTNPDDLVKIQNQYPDVEWGILLSSKWSDNNHRFPDPSTLIERFGGRGLRLSGHLCGELAREVARGFWTKTEEVLGDTMEIFQRVQVNEPVAGFYWDAKPLPWNLQELIQQRKFPEDIDYSPVSKGFSVLLDPSGGCGIPSMPVPTGYSGKIGYAGGIGPLNVKDVLREIQRIPEDGEVWIDMESSVRGDGDWFDTGIVRRVLELVYG